MTRNCLNLLRKCASIDKEDDSQLTSSVNALSALSTLAGTGLVASGIGSDSYDAKYNGGVLDGAGITSAALYHLSRVLKAKKLTRALMWGVGAIGGGIAGGKLLSDIYTPMRSNHHVNVTLTGMPQVEVRQAPFDRWNLGKVYADVNANIRNNK